MIAWLALALALLADLLLVCLAAGVLWAARKAKPYMTMFAPSGPPRPRNSSSTR